jgi:dihydropteroate synthase
MHDWHCRHIRISFDRPRILGIVNVTPDSFSDGGQFFDPSHAVDHALQLVQDGADILDIGGESTRPGSTPVTTEEELRRVVPVIRELAKRTSAPISIDTSKAAVAEAAIDAGAVIVNDVTAFTGDPGMMEVCANSGVGVILMHMQGTPQTMQLQPTYSDVVREVWQHLFVQRLEAICHGIAVESICVDPGIGFGKNLDHNLRLIAELSAFRDLGPICLGVSRKGIIRKLCNGRDGPDTRLAGSLAFAAFAHTHRSVDILRVHDVAATRDVIDVIHGLNAYSTEPTPAQHP